MSEQQPQGATGLPIVGNMLAFARQPHRYLLNLALEHGDIAHFKLGVIDAYVIANPPGKQYQSERRLVKVRILC